MRGLRRLLSLALLGASGTAIAGTLPLHSGYNHGAATPGYYGPNDTQDNYWIKIASYEPPAGSVPVAPANIYPWVPGLPRTLGPNSSGASSPGTDVSNKAYAIYRKCFCLLSTENVSFNFWVKGDDAITVWLNTVTNTLVSPLGWPTAASWHQAGPTNTAMFREGRNCVYVLVEDYWSGTSFSVFGSVTAPGLMPMMAKGPDASFEPCHCPEPPKPGTTPAPQQGAPTQMIDRADRARPPVPAPEAPPVDEKPPLQEGAAPSAETEADGEPR